MKTKLKTAKKAKAKKFVYQDLLAKLGACSDARHWTADKPIKEAWETCERADWMLWLCERMEVDRKILVMAACACARTSLKYVKNGEDRPRVAIETAEAWCRGKATIREVRSAADAAAAAAAAVLSVSESTVKRLEVAGQLRTVGAGKMIRTGVCEGKAMSNKIYRVTAYRFGNANQTPWGRPYDVGFYTSVETAKAIASGERHDRGGKYECAVWEIVLDDGSDPVLVYYTDDGEPKEDQLSQFYLQVGYSYGKKIIAGEIPMESVGEGYGQIQCAGMVACIHKNGSIGPGFDVLWGKYQAFLLAKKDGTP